MTYDVIIIGGGASGLQAGIQALKKGYKNTLILEREDYLGGNLNLFIHSGFDKLTGPELATKLIREFKSLGGEYKVKTNVLNVGKEKQVTYVNPDEKIVTISSKKIIIASGIRERFTGNIIIPIHKYSGIFTIAAAHKMINFKGYLPGKNVVISGRNRWSLFLARRLFIEGANIKAFLIDEHAEMNISNEDLKIIEGFNIPIIKNCTICELSGGDRIEEVTVYNRESKEEKIISCDSLIISVGYYPSIDFIKDDEIIIGKEYKTNSEGIYVCGTARLGEEILETSYMDAINLFCN